MIVVTMLYKDMLYICFGSHYGGGGGGVER